MSIGKLDYGYLTQNLPLPMGFEIMSGFWLGTVFFQVLHPEVILIIDVEFMLYFFIQISMCEENTAFSLTSVPYKSLISVNRQVVTRVSVYSLHMAPVRLDC